MRIFPPPIEIAEDEGFTAEKDIFGRAEFGKGLSNLLQASEDPMVIVLDGPWGSGKTIFIKMLAGLLRQNGHPVIYFDAFKSDFLDDAFLALAGEVIGLSQTLKNEATPAHKKFLNRAARTARTVVRSGAKLGIKAATLGALDAADVSELASITKDIADETSKQADEYISSLLSRQIDERKNIDKLRESISELATILAEKLKTSDDDFSIRQLVFIVDELDRCRPNFALEILEKIKHIFSVTGIHFILVTHLEQLESSVRFNYGADVEARDYLQKFYNLIVHLPADGRYQHERIARKFFSYLRQNLKSDDDALKFIEAIADARHLTLRPIERMVTYMSLAIAFTTSKTTRYFRPPPILGGLCALKTLEPKLFQKAKAGTLTLSEASAAFGFLDWPSEHSLNWSKKFWQFALDDEKNLKGEEWRNFGGIGSQFHFDDRKDIVRFVANDVIDRMQIPEE